MQFLVLPGVVFVSLFCLFGDGFRFFALLIVLPYCCVQPRQFGPGLEDVLNQVPNASS